MLWCVSHQVQAYLGDAGVISMIPIVLFFGTGILSEEDFNQFKWSIVLSVRLRSLWHVVLIYMVQLGYGWDYIGQGCSVKWIVGQS